MTRSIGALQKRTGLRNLAVGGGVYANVRLNRHLLENTAAEAIFIFPAMGDEGLPIGGCLDYLLQQRGPEEWRRNRRVLELDVAGSRPPPRSRRARGGLPKTAAVAD